MGHRSPCEGEPDREALRTSLAFLLGFFFLIGGRGQLSWLLVVYRRHIRRVLPIVRRVQVTSRYSAPFTTVRDDEDWCEGPGGLPRCSLTHEGDTADLRECRPE